MSEKQPAAYYLKSIQEGFQKMKDILIQRFTSDNSTIMTNHSELREKIYQFNQAKATTKEKVEVNKYVRDNIQQFIKRYVQVKLVPLNKLSADPRKFVETLNRVWTHYQIFIFCHFFACEKINEFFGSFYRMSNAKDYEYKTSLGINFRYEIAPVPTMGVNQLKYFFQQIRMIQSFRQIFNQFLRDERSQKNVPKEEIRESIHSLESCYFDMDAYCELSDQKPRLIKRQIKNEKLSNNRRSKDGQFFSDHLLDPTIQNLGKYYSEQFVQKRAMNMNSTDEIQKMIKIINQEEARAYYYIHSNLNRQKYILTLNQNLIIKDLQKRITKEDGLKRYLQLYEENKAEYQQQLKDFWKVYSRVIEVSLPFIKTLFNNYLIFEAKKVGEKVKIPPEFVSQLIRINGKCFKITNIFGNNFDLENDRNSKIRDMMSNCITEAGKKEAKYDYGAKNLASFINNKFKMSYSKGCLAALGDEYKQLVALFKILLQKSRFIDEHHKHLGTRLLEEIEFSNDLVARNILLLEKQFINEIQKQCGVSEVRELTEVIKDIEKSIENNGKLITKMGEAAIHPIKQIIVKNANNWPQKNAYKVDNPPNEILRSINAVSDYFKKENANILFQFNSGISLFKGEFDNGKKQNFQFKNIYMMILLYIDEAKRMFYGDLKKKMEATGINRLKGQIQLVRAVIQLYYSGLITSTTKSIKPGTPEICKLSDTDVFEINRKYDFVEEEKRKKGSKGPAPKPIAVVKGNILILSEELKRGFDQETKALNNDEKLIEAERKFKVECITVKTLKHAHHHNKDCNFEGLFKVTQQGKNKQFRVNEKFLKEIIEELIIKRYCERVQGQRNVFRYIA